MSEELDPNEQLHGLEVAQVASDRTQLSAQAQPRLLNLYQLVPHVYKWLSL